MTLCQRCGIVMRLLNTARSWLLLYWCPSCQRFAESYQLATASDQPRPLARSRRADR
jgi:hypothetical protein